MPHLSMALNKRGRSSGSGFYTEGLTFEASDLRVPILTMRAFVTHGADTVEVPVYRNAVYTPTRWTIANPQTVDPDFVTFVWLDAYGVVGTFEVDVASNSGNPTFTASELWISDSGQDRMHVQQAGLPADTLLVGIGYGLADRATAEVLRDLGAGARYGFRTAARFGTPVLLPVAFLLAVSVPAGGASSQFDVTAANTVNPVAFVEAVSLHGFGRLILPTATPLVGITIGEVEQAIENARYWLPSIDGVNRLVYDVPGILFVVEVVGNQVVNAYKYILPDPFDVVAGQVTREQMLALSLAITAAAHAGAVALEEMQTLMVDGGGQPPQFRFLALESYGTGAEEIEHEEQVPVPAELEKAIRHVMETVAKHDEWANMSSTEALHGAVALVWSHNLANSGAWRARVNWYWDNATTPVAPPVNCPPSGSQPPIRRCTEPAIANGVSFMDWLTPGGPDKLETLNIDWNDVGATDQLSSKGVFHKEVGQRLELLHPGKLPLDALHDEMDSTVQLAPGSDADLRVAYEYLPEAADTLRIRFVKPQALDECDP